MLMEEVELLRAACCVAGLDGEIDEREMRLIWKLAERAQVGTMSVQAMVEMARSDPSFFERQLVLTRSDPEGTMRVLLRMAAIDGDVSRNERIVLRHFADRIGLGEEGFQRVVRRMRDEARERRSRE